MKDYLILTKSGIVFFVLITSSLGYLLALNDFSDFSLAQFSGLLFFLYFVSSGSFILNQVQEWKLDSKMDRTHQRPIPQKKISLLQAGILGVAFIVFGGLGLYMIKPLTSYIALATVFLYNICYTMYWKPGFYHGAVLGALPGALPPVIGASLAESYLLTTECIYLFLIMFLWQMPHFWILAIKYKSDYKKGGIPVLPASVYGQEKTIREMGFYLLAYLGVVLISPLFLRAGIMYVLFALPFVAKLLHEFFKYSKQSHKWLSFFLWINASVIVYLFVPIIDKWFFHYLILF